MLLYYQKVYNDLLDKIKNNVLVPNELIPFEYELAKSYDVSKTTIRRALNMLQNDGLIIKVKGKGSVVNKDITCAEVTNNNNVGILFLLFDEQSANTYPKMYEYSNSWANKIYRSVFTDLSNDYNVLVDSIMADQVESKFEQSILNGVDKLLLLGKAKKEVISFLQSRGKHIVVYNCYDESIHTCKVCSDGRNVFKKAVEHLAANNHKQIAIINGLTTFDESLQRFMGYQDGIIKSKLLIFPEYIKWGDMTPESGYFLMNELLDLNNRPTAVICVNDGVAIGVYDAIKRRGLQIPTDISVIGHDNSLTGGKLQPGLTTICPKYEYIGKIIANKLRRQVWIHDKTIIEGNLFVKNSVESCKSKVNL